MLSIAIPTYNYNAFPLVEKLFILCKKANIAFEILCYDDGSLAVETLEKNKKINELDNCRYIIGEKNKGLSFSRNYLITHSNYENVLLLDADMMPENDYFIKNYLPFCTEDYDVVFGGISYQKNKDLDKQLRYIYGTNRESINYKQRNNNPYRLVFYSNTLLNKNSIKEVNFDENLKTYGYEDVLFTKFIKKLNLKVKHINNSAYHSHNDSSNNYIKKSENALKNLAKLYQNKTFDKSDSSILKAYEILQKYYLLLLFKVFYRFFKPLIYKNLVSKKPRLFWFDVYKLGYFCSEIKP